MLNTIKTLNIMNKLTLTHVFETYHLKLNGKEYEVRVNAMNNRTINVVFENGELLDEVPQDVYDFVNIELSKLK